MNDVMNKNKTEDTPQYLPFYFCEKKLTTHQDSITSKGVV